MCEWKEKMCIFFYMLSLSLFIFECMYMYIFVVYDIGAEQNYFRGVRTLSGAGEGMERHI